MSDAAMTESKRRDLLARLNHRLGPAAARKRLAIETDSPEQRAARHRWGGLNALRGTITVALKMAGLYGRGANNAAQVEVRHNRVELEGLPASFEGYSILHISDLHVDDNPRAMERLVELLGDVPHDVCVLTGDFRGKTFGPFDATIEGLRRMRARLAGPVYGVLGNHDTIEMVPALEDLGIRMLLNECDVIARGADVCYLAGIDDAHYLGAHDIQKATAQIPPGAFSILLSHTPDVYREAAAAGCHLLLAGHTHGGQLCLPGSIPVVLDADVPRRMGSGAWRHQGMMGYTSSGVGTSVVPVRMNCPPEITVHRLGRAPARTG